MKKKSNPQEKFWQGNFGNNYIKRNNSPKIIKNNFYLFKKIFNKKIKINSLIELGSNIGLNIIALKKIFKDLRITAVEINKNACRNLKKIKKVNIINDSILNFKSKSKFDLVLVKGVLIHIHHRDLLNLFKKINQLSKKYVLICEYYNPYPISISYRGYNNKLFKNDYAGLFLKKYKNYKLVNYGFCYHLDKYPLDDVNWFLLKKF